MWQRGYILVQSGTINYLDNDAWLDHTDVFNPANTNLMNMVDTVNSGGSAVELYFVNLMDSTLCAGLYHDKGIVISKRGTGMTIAHEVLHSAGLEDIYVFGDSGESLPEELTINRITNAWGGGYYSPISIL